MIETATSNLFKIIFTVVGPNGSGKSTFLRLLIGKEKPDEGVAEIVGQNVEMSYFEQNQADALDLDKTVLETIQGASTGQSYNELRALLGQFLFKGDDVEKKVENLSGGEKARLSLCCMMLTESNLLILDEPTNHLGKQLSYCYDFFGVQELALLLLVRSVFRLLTLFSCFLCLLQISRPRKCLRRLCSTSLVLF